MKIVRILIILVVIFVVSIFIKLPSRPIRGDISKIIIKYSNRDVSKEFVLEESEQIKNLKNACGTIWYSPFGVNSWEGSPRWMIQIYRPDGSVDKIYVDEDEFGTRGFPNKRILNYLKQKYS
jgi:hypothetical protein